MDDRTKENTTNDNVPIQADALTDLSVSDERTDETKGGQLGGHVRVFNGQVGSLVIP